MGAVDIQYTFAGTADELRSDFHRRCEQAAAEYGHSHYSGSMSSAHSLRLQPNKRFTDTQAAGDYIDGLSLGKNEYLAVRLSLPAKPYRIARADEYEKLDKANRNLQTEINQAPKLALAAVKSAKTAKRGCGTCLGVIPVTYLRSLDCPICHAPMFCVSTTERKRLDGLNAKLVAARERLERTEREFNEAAKDRIESWFVMGYASE
jgi:hypothetical protein